MDFSQYKNIEQFYQETGMTQIQTYEFLLKECEKRKIFEGVRQDGKQQF